MLRNYLMIALKVLARRKFYTFVSLFGIAITLLILMVVTALADHLLAPAPPESNLGRMLMITRARISGPNVSSSGSAGYALLDQYARDLPYVERLSILSSPSRVTSYVDGVKIDTRLRRTDAEYWRILDFEFIEGGPFDEDDTSSGRFVAVINETTRKRFFDGKPAVGQSVRFDGQLFRVVGVTRDVMPTRLMAFAEAWVPIGTSKSTAYKSRLRGGFNGVLLARSRADFHEIKAEFERRIAEAQLPDPEQYDKLESSANTMVEEISREFLGRYGPDDPPVARLFTFIVLGMLLFMLLPAINLVNLSLSRILERSSEIGVRKAFGASSTTLIGQFLVESVVLTVIGGAVGFALTAVALEVLNRSELIPYGAFTVNLRVFAIGLLLSVVFGIISGVYPAWRMSRLHPVESIQGRAS